MRFGNGGSGMGLYAHGSQLPCRARPRPLGLWGGGWCHGVSTALLSGISACVPRNGEDRIRPKCKGEDTPSESPGSLLSQEKVSWRCQGRLSAVSAGRYLHACPESSLNSVCWWRGDWCSQWESHSSHAAWLTRGRFRLRVAVSSGIHTPQPSGPAQPAAYL